MHLLFKCGSGLLFDEQSTWTRRDNADPSWTGRQTHADFAGYYMFSLNLISLYAGHGLHV